jgi:hypothetical protein
MLYVLFIKFSTFPSYSILRIKNMDGKGKNLRKSGIFMPLTEQLTHIGKVEMKLQSSSVS